MTTEQKQNKAEVLKNIKRFHSDYLRDIVWWKLWGGTNTMLYIAPNPIIAVRLIAQIENYNNANCETGIEYFVKEKTAVWMTGVRYDGEDYEAIWMKELEEKMKLKFAAIKKKKQK